MHSRRSINDGYCHHPRNCICYDILFYFITFLRYKGQDFYVHFKDRETETQVAQDIRSFKQPVGSEAGTSLPTRPPDACLPMLPGYQPRGRGICPQCVNSQGLKTESRDSGSSTHSHGGDSPARVRAGICPSTFPPPNPGDGGAAGPAVEEGASRPSSTWAGHGVWGRLRPPAQGSPRVPDAPKLWTVPRVRG